MSWTPERKEQLRVLIEAKKSASEAGAALGVTRNAAMGAANRMGLRFLSVAPNIGPRKKRFGQPRKQTRGPAIMISQKFPYNALPVDETPQEIKQSLNEFNASLPSDQLKTIWELKDRGMCKYIVSGEGEHSLYCAGHVEGEGSWCSGHKAFIFGRWVAAA